METTKDTGKVSKVKKEILNLRLEAAQTQPTQKDRVAGKEETQTNQQRVKEKLRPKYTRANEQMKNRCSQKKSMKTEKRHTRIKSTKYNGNRTKNPNRDNYG